MAFHSIPKKCWQIFEQQDDDKVDGWSNEKEKKKM